MPRDMIFKRRFLADRVEFPSTPPASAIIIVPPTDRRSFEEDRAMSDYSSDSGRESTLPGELGQLSPSVSFDASRPVQLNLGQESATSSTSSDSLPAKSPLSPMHPMGHISSLPRILQNLAVSGNQQEIADMRQLSFVQGEQTSGRERQLAQPPCYVDAGQSGGQCPLTVQLRHPTPLPPASSFLSPTSRKRTNSVTNAVDNATPNATTRMAAGRPAPKHRRTKGGRQVAPDELTSSPITGTIIREISDGPLDNVIIVRRGDVDRSINVVEITEEKRAAIAKIDNIIGDYVCRLCKVKYEDVFALAGHNCPQIVHLEYQCPECGKSFHCPANLASHRRWHKPKAATKTVSGRDGAVAPSAKTPSISNSSSNSSIPASILTTNADDKEIETLIEKPSKFNVPFKKRFFFRKDSGKDTASIKSSSEDVRKDSMSSKISTDSVSTGGSTHGNNGLSTYETLLQGKMMVHDAPNYECGLCGMLVQGVQNYAHHWQTCLPTAVRRNWSAVLCKVPK